MSFLARSSAPIMTHRSAIDAHLSKFILGQSSLGLLCGILPSSKLRSAPYHDHTQGAAPRQGCPRWDAAQTHVLYSQLRGTKQLFFFLEERLTEEIRQIYGSVSGLFDLGPPGTALQSNLLDIWRKHFVRKSILPLNYTVQC